MKLILNVIPGSRTGRWKDSEKKQRPMHRLIIKVTAACILATGIPAMSTEHLPDSAT